MKDPYSWPGQATELVMRDAQIALDECGCLPWEWASFGYPGRAPLPIALKALTLAQKINPNNIGDHSLPFRQAGYKQTEHGFDGTQRLEREAIARLAQLAGGDPSTIGGYLCEGGTTANLAGLWMGRNYLRTQPGAKRTVIITTRLAHYSILKAADILGFNPNDIIYAPCNRSGGISVCDITELASRLHSESVTGLLFVCTAGSTMMGSVDDVSQVNELRAGLRLAGISTYIHVDAAFGGLVLPFLDKPVRFGFDQGADSVVIDPHKMGGVPFGCGAILYQEQYAGPVAVKAPYLNSEQDWTINGSSSGANAVALWAVLEEQGFNQLAKCVQQCIALRDYASEQLDQVDHFQVHVGQTNQLCLEITDLSVVERLATRVCNHPYYMHVAPFPKRFDDPNCQEGRALKMILMPHHTKQMVDKFVRQVKL